MSLVGIDLGTSAIKVAAYAIDGTALAEATTPIGAHRPQPGHWEVDVEESRRAFRSAVRDVAAHPALRMDVPVAVSFSSSGREVFPSTADGTPLGPCLMTADTRGDEVAERLAALHTDDDWFRIAGHVPRRMDPVCRALWWREHDPAVAARTRWFMNWHEYYALLLSGRPVIDWSDAGTWATYDLSSGGWSVDRVEETGIDPRWLPDVQANGTPIGTILPAAAAEYGLPRDLLVVTGAYDTFAASVGSAAVDPGVVSLSCGTWHSFNLAVRPGWSPDLVRDGVSVVPHPGPTGFGILVTDPNGMSVIDWTRELVGMSIGELDAGLATVGPGPGHVTADSAFTPLPHVDASSGFGATISGLTLASTRIDVVRAVMEGIALRFAIKLDGLRERGIDSTLIRATGGGSASAWWMQLHADLTGIPVEIVGHDQPGTFGAAILAGVGAGLYESVSSAEAAFVRVSKRFEPDGTRAAHYAAWRARLASVVG